MNGDSPSVFSLQFIISNVGDKGIVWILTYSGKSSRFVECLLMEPRRPIINSSPQNFETHRIFSEFPSLAYLS